MKRTFATLALGAALIAACASGKPPAPPPQASELAAHLDAVIGKAHASIVRAPGIAVAVWTPEGSYARAFGPTDIDTGEKATADTAFYIASTTKAVTALAFDILHQRGELNLDQPLTQFLPQAPFPAAVHPEATTPRMLLNHTSGIANDPISFRSAYTGDHTPELLWGLLATSQVNLQVPAPKFSYTNTGYNILTILTDRRLGVKWQDLLAREIFEPAGMAHTTAYMSKARGEGWSIARPHASMTEVGAQRLDLQKTDGMMQSAGGLVMSANDALRWLELHVNDGRIGGKQVIAAAAVREVREMTVETGQSGGDMSRDRYGLGWFIGKFEGETIAHHGGGFAGFSSLISFMPDRRYGVAVFVNDSGAGSGFPEAITRHVYEKLLGRSGDDVDASARRIAESFTTRMRAIAADLASRAGRKWQLSQPFAAYAGTYASPQIGTLVIAFDGQKLSASLGPLRSEIEPYTQPDTMRMSIAGSGMVVRFAVDPSGKVTSAIFNGARFERQ